jgi:hypothetical protein
MLKILSIAGFIKANLIKITLIETSPLPASLAPKGSLLEKRSGGVKKFAFLQFLCTFGPQFR